MTWEECPHCGRHRGEMHICPLNEVDGLRKRAAWHREEAARILREAETRAANLERAARDDERTADHIERLCIYR